ncbi:MAG: stage V sporulation protein AC [Heliobacteriaceae bacterium]|nr:stage V sporulation protein AC [Heliobacteriaceae bacterium]MDD4587302.1 stage V sporulation protein AC [Heliobacteriaceae bacterium]
MVKEVKPKPTVLKNAVLAFVVGGLICALGQIMFFSYLSMGLPEQDATSATAGTLVFLGALLTGLGWYDTLGKFAGAGSIVPITGFSNSIVASALEFKREGYIFGVGAKMFIIAGPVLVYGFMTSALIGLTYYLVR